MGQRHAAGCLRSQHKAHATGLPEGPVRITAWRIFLFRFRNRQQIPNQGTRLAELFREDSQRGKGAAVAGAACSSSHAACANHASDRRCSETASYEPPGNHIIQCCPSPAHCCTFHDAFSCHTYHCSILCTCHAVAQHARKSKLCQRSLCGSSGPTSGRVRRSAPYSCWISAVFEPIFCLCGG